MAVEKTRINSRRKGKNNERNLAKVLETWTGFKFASTPSSGGLRWQRKRDTVGDIICVDEQHSLIFPFSIEAKFYREIHFQDLLFPNKKKVKIKEFWEQATADARRANKIPILAMRYNGMPSAEYFIVLRTKDYARMGITLKHTLTFKTKFIIGTFSELLTNDYNKILCKLSQESGQ